MSAVRRTWCCLFSLLLVCSVFAVPAVAAKDAMPDWVRTAIVKPLPTLSKDVPAVVLMDATVFTVAGDGRAVEHRRRVVKILRPQGRDKGMVAIPFDGEQQLLSLHVWSVGPDGHEYTIKDSEIADVGFPGSGNLYDDQRARVVSPPGRDPGGIVAFEYEQRSRPYVHEKYWFFQTDLPAFDESFTLELPPGYIQTTTWAHHAPERAVDLEHQRLRWQLASVPPVDLDRVLMAPEPESLEGRMTVHYGPAGAAGALGTWQEVGGSYDRIAHDRMAASPEIAAKTAQLTAGKSDFADQVEAVAEFVQKDIRYFVIEKGIGGIQPHPAAEIYRNRFGDCKDKATLLASMLSTIGVHATLVLVDSRRGMVDPAAPSSLGNHAIAAVEVPAGYTSPKLRSVVTTRTGKRFLIVDPTSEKTAFGQLEHNLQGGYAVLVEPAESEIVELPVLGPELNSIRRSGTLKLLADGSLKGQIVERRFGDVSEHTRYLYTRADATERQTSLERRLRQDFSSFTTGAVKVDDAAALNKDVVTTFDLTADHYSRAMGPLLMVRPRVMGSESMTLDHKPREVPINLDQAMQHIDDFTIELPEGYALDELPEPVKLDVGFAAYESESRLDGNALHYRRSYTVRAVTVPAEKYGDLERLVAAIDADEQNRAVLKKQ